MPLKEYTERIHWRSKTSDRHISAKLKDIDSQIGGKLENGPINVTEGKNSEFWENKMAAER